MHCEQPVTVTPLKNVVITEKSKHTTPLFSSIENELNATLINQSRKNRGKASSYRRFFSTISCLNSSPLVRTNPSQTLKKVNPKISPIYLQLRDVTNEQRGNSWDIDNRELKKSDPPNFGSVTGKMHVINYTALSVVREIVGPLEKKLHESSIRSIFT